MVRKPEGRGCRVYVCQSLKLEVIEEEDKSAKGEGDHAAFTHDST
jgi:hypothetical protein